MAEKYDGRFFGICPKCDAKNYEHISSVEFPKGKHTLNVRCFNCRHEFQHIIMSTNARQEEAMDRAHRKMKFMTSKEGIKKIAGIVKKGLDGGD